jgi:flagellar biosynthetic protein FliQ
MEQIPLSISDIMNISIWTTLKASIPILLVAMAIGLTIGIIQTATSIQEQTLIFIPKVLGVFFALIIMGPWIASQVLELAKATLGQLERFVK